MRGSAQNLKEAGDCYEKAKRANFMDVAFNLSSNCKKILITRDIKKYIQLFFVGVLLKLLPLRGPSLKSLWRWKLKLQVS